MPSAAPREIELKLELEPADLADLKARILPKLGPSGATQRLVSVYYDTDKHDLRAKGLSVRVRSVGDRHVQTVKATKGSNAGLFDRSEWETELHGTTLDLKALAETPAASLVHDDAKRLKPVFETIIDRTIWTVETKRATIEVALDEGQVTAKKASKPLVELELELKRGKVPELFKLLRQFEGLASLKTGVRAKSERGYALLGGKKPKAFKAEPVGLTPDMTTAEAFRAIMYRCIRQFRLNEPLVIGTRAAEPLHQARVAMRRLRSALSLFQDIVDDDRLDMLKTKFRDVSRAFGEARNLDVYLAHSARPEAERDRAEPGVAAFLMDMEQRRGHAYDRVVETLASKAFRGLMVDLIEWIEAGPWVIDADPMRTALRTQRVPLYAADVLDTWRRKVKKKGKRLDELDPHARHRVRIAAKKLRYASEFFAGLARADKEQERHAAFIAALEDLQQHLGDLNDIQTGHDIALTLAGEGAMPNGGLPPAVFAAAHVSGEQDSRVEELLREAVVAHGKVADAKRFWSKWQD